MTRLAGTPSFSGLFFSILLESFRFEVEDDYEYEVFSILSSALAWNSVNREIKIHVYAKGQTWICTTWPSFSLNCRKLFITSIKKIGSFTPVLYIRIVLDSFYLLILFSEKFSTWICRLPFGVNVNSVLISPFWRGKRDSRRQSTTGFGENVVVAEASY